MTPRICVLLPVYNNPEGLRKTLESLARAHGAFDVIVVDDGSTPPVTLAPGAAGRHSTILIRLSRNHGLTRALNIGLGKALEYEYVARLDAADSVHPARFVLQSEHLDRNPGCGVVGAWVDFVGTDERLLFSYRPPVGEQELARRMRLENCIIHSSVMMRASVLQQVGGYAFAMCVTEDYDLFLRIGQVAGLAVLPRTLTFCEYNFTGISVSKRRRQQRQRLRLQLSHFDVRCWSSYFGLLRTCAALCAPHALVLGWKQALAWKQDLVKGFGLETNPQRETNRPPVGACMKILLIAEAAAAGVGRHVIDLAFGLHAAGHRVHVLYSPLRADRIFLQGVQRGGGLAGLHFPPCAMRRWPALSDVGALWKIRGIARAHGPFDVVHAHSTKAGLLGRLPAFVSAQRRVYTPHAPLTLNPALRPMARRCLAAYERILARSTDAIVAVSADEAAHLRSLGIAPVKIHLIPNGIAPSVPAPLAAGEDRIAPAGGPGQSAPSLRIGYLGRFARQKRVDNLLRSFALHLQTVPGSRLHLAGSGPEEPHLKRLAIELGIAASVRWLGERSRGVLRSFDVLALASDYEGCPYVVLEALAAGVPVVATRAGGIEQLIENGVHGRTVPVGEVAEFARALSELARRQVRSDMARNALRRAEDFTLDRMLRETLAIYHPPAPPLSPEPGPSSHGPLADPVLKSFHDLSSTAR